MQSANLAVDFPPTVPMHEVANDSLNGDLEFYSVKFDHDSQYFTNKTNFKWSDFAANLIISSCYSMDPFCIYNIHVVCLGVQIILS